MDVWSNHACSGGSVKLVLARPQDMHPLAKTMAPRTVIPRTRERLNTPSFQRPPKINRLAVTGSGKEFTLTLGHIPRELLDLHFSKGQSSSQC